jgi:hypothetical protein
MRMKNKPTLKVTEDLLQNSELFFEVDEVLSYREITPMEDMPYIELTLTHPFGRKPPSPHSSRKVIPGLGIDPGSILIQ